MPEKPAEQGSDPRPCCRTLVPPYDRNSASATVEVLETSRLPFGAVLIPTLDAAEVPALEITIAFLRRRHPGHPVALQLPRSPDSTPLHVAWRAGRLGVRAILLQGDPVAPALRTMLTHSEDLAADLLDWFEAARLGPAAALSPAGRANVDAGGRALMGEVAERLQVAERTLRDRFAAAGVPPPAAWAGLARALSAALHLQRHPDASLASSALASGYSDQPALAHALRREFDLTPVQVRTVLGWEPLLDRWTARWPDRR